jgi:ribosomal protein S12 methylthiotransferase accessory factor YcaO
LVETASLPDEVREIVDRAERNGLQLKVRTIPNDYGMPFFAVFVFDLNNPSRKTFNGGWACDLDRDRALVRAVTEAAQSRVAFIHGGRKVPTLRAEGWLLGRSRAGSETCAATHFGCNRLPAPGVAD